MYRVKSTTKNAVGVATVEDATSRLVTVGSRWLVCSRVALLPTANDQLPTVTLPCPTKLSIQGALAETTVPDLFRSLVRSSETAILSLDAIGRNDTIYFRKGRSSTRRAPIPTWGWPRRCCGSGELNLQQYDTAMERLVVSRRIGSLLCELGYLKPDELTRAVERQAERDRAQRDGVSHRQLHDRVHVRLSGRDHHAAAGDGAADPRRRPAIEYWSLICAASGGSTACWNRCRAPTCARYNLELNDDENQSSRCSASRRPSSSSARAATSRTSSPAAPLWGLLTVNLVQDAAEEEMSEKRAAEEIEYELEELVEKYNGAFPDRSSAIVFQKIGDHVYDFMDRVVLHLSPETMPYLSGMNLVNEARIDFDQLLNNLIASPARSDHATIVQSVLNELLYGWILEIKAEFGPEAEAEVVKMAEIVETMNATSNMTRSNPDAERSCVCPLPSPSVCSVRLRSAKAAERPRVEPARRPTTSGCRRCGSADGAAAECDAQGADRARCSTNHNKLEPTYDAVHRQAATRTTTARPIPRAAALLAREKIILGDEYMTVLSRYDRAIALYREALEIRAAERRRAQRIALAEQQRSSSMNAVRQREDGDEGRGSAEASSACRARTGSSRSCRTTASIPSGFTRSPTAAPRPSTLTTASFITQTGTLPHRRQAGK